MLISSRLLEDRDTEVGWSPTYLCHPAHALGPKLGSQVFLGSSSSLEVTLDPFPSDPGVSAAVAILLVLADDVEGVLGGDEQR